MAETRFERATKDLRALAIKPAARSVWHVDLPWAFWRWKQAMRERVALLERLLTEDTCCGFHLDAERRGDVTDSVGADDRLLPESAAWLFVRSAAAVAVVEDLHWGEWALFLFDQCPSEAPPFPAQLDVEPEALRSLTEGRGASGCILSWPDDREWLVVDLGR